MTANATFSHRDEGTPEVAWQQAFHERMPGLPALTPDFFEALDHLIVVAAHPDDETLGAAGLIGRAGASGVRVTVIVATSGEALHPDAVVDSANLARRRENETSAAVGAVDAGATVAFLRLPDGALSDHRDDLVGAITAAVGAVSSAADAERAHGAERARAWDRTVLVAPWAGDRHPDHTAAAEAARAVAQGEGLDVLEYPIWLWHWAEPDAEVVPWARLQLLHLEADEVAAKDRAISSHASQVLPLGDGEDAEGTDGNDCDGDPAHPLLHAGMLAHFARPFEAFVASTVAPATEVPRPATESPNSAAIGGRIPSESGDSTTPTAHDAPSVLHEEAVARAYFDELHEGVDDPWGFESRWYEERKRAILLASLPDRVYREVLEVGSSTGVLSRQLARRASARFVGVDVSQVAVDRARDRTADLSQVSFERMGVPAEWPHGAFDLVVVSEVGYYLDPPDLTGLIERILGSLTAQGAVVCCHWRHPVAGRSVDGDAVHAVFAQRQEFTRLARHLEDDFVLDVLVRAPGESVARREGIV